MSAAQRNVNKGHRRMSRNLLWSGVLILAGAAAYANSLHGPFILDDDRHIVNDRHIVSLSDFQQLFEHTHWTYFSAVTPAGFHFNSAQTTVNNRRSWETFNILCVFVEAL